MQALFGISQDADGSVDGATAGAVLLERVREVKDAFVGAAAGDADSTGIGYGPSAASRRALIDAYQESKLAILDSFLG